MSIRPWLNICSTNANAKCPYRVAQSHTSGDLLSNYKDLGYVGGRKSGGIESVSGPFRAISTRP